VLVFFKTPDMDSRFLKSLKIYSLNSLLVNLHDLIVLILFFNLNTQLWSFNSTDFYADTKFTFYYAYIYLPIWSVFYTFGGKFSHSASPVYKDFNLGFYI
jgi:hypothetical protein